MASGPVVAMVWQGLDAVKTGRVMLGATNPLASAPGQFCFILSYLISCLMIVDLIGTIRGDFALAVGRNICHGSDAVESAEKEIALYVILFHDRILCTDSFYSWFPEGVVQYTQDQAKWIFE